MNFSDDSTNICVFQRKCPLCKGEHANVCSWKYFEVLRQGSYFLIHPKPLTGGGSAPNLLGNCANISRAERGCWSSTCSISCVDCRIWSTIVDILWTLFTAIFKFRCKILGVTLRQTILAEQEKECTTPKSTTFFFPPKKCTITKIVFLGWKHFWS